MPQITSLKALREAGARAALVAAEGMRTGNRGHAARRAGASADEVRVRWLDGAVAKARGAARGSTEVKGERPRSRRRWRARRWPLIGTRGARLDDARDG